MKWNTIQENQRARCGPLYVRIEEGGPLYVRIEDGDPGLEYTWFVEPDDEDKSYRRALATGTSPTTGMARDAAAQACLRIIESMIAGLIETGDVADPFPACATRDIMDQIRVAMGRGHAGTPATP